MLRIGATRPKNNQGEKMAITISGGVQLSGPVVLTQSSGGSGPSGASDGYVSGGDNGPST